MRTKYPKELPGVPVQHKEGGNQGVYEEKYCWLVYHLALLGATTDRIAEVIGVHSNTLVYWRDHSEEFKKAWEAGKDQADGEVAAALFSRAKGYSHPDIHIAVYKDRASGEIEVIQTPITKYYAPDTIACIFWLKNRQRELWKDTYRTEHTGKDGKPIENRVALDLSSLTNAQLELAEQLGLNLHGFKDADEELDRRMDSAEHGGGHRVQ